MTGICAFETLERRLESKLSCHCGSPSLDVGLKARIFPSKIAAINVTLPLLALFIATFCIATTELAVVGLISEIARDLVVSIPKAGLLVSGDALGVAVGGPVFTIATASLSRKIALLFMMGVFVAGHALAAVAPNYAVLMIARVVAATCHTSFLGVAAVVAASSVPADRSARGGLDGVARIFRSELVGGSGGRGARPCLWLAVYVLGANRPRLRQSPRYRPLGSGNGPARGGKLGAGI
jgi:MFS family permease